MLSINDLRVGTIFVYEGAPYEVLEAKHIFLGRGSSSLQVKIKNLITGQVFSKSFKPADRFEEAEIERRDIKYLYNHRGEFWFCQPNNPSERFSLKEEVIGQGKNFLKANSIVKAMVFQGDIVGIELPIKMDFKVIEAPPGVRGDTVQRATKTVTIETGAQIKTPLFINQGDIIRVNTRTGEYVERVRKA